MFHSHNRIVKIIIILMSWWSYVFYSVQVNLCFDQLVYKLSEQIFQYYKHLAAR